MKNNSLPNLNIGTLKEDSVASDKFFGIDVEKFEEKIMKNFLSRNTMEDVMGKNLLISDDKIMVESLQTFVEMYDDLTDREFVFAMFQYVKAHIKMSCIEIL